MNITPALLRAAVGCTAELADIYADHLADACSLNDINTPARLAAFLAQVGHESGSLKHTAELWGPTDAQRTYEGRKSLGNTQIGDGYYFRGRGLIQCTGRANMTQMAEWLNLDLLRSPELLEQPRWAALSAATWWARNGCNQLADAGDFVALTKRINGGVNGLEDRQRRWEKAKKALAVDTSPEPAQETQKSVHVPPRPDAEPYAAAPAPQQEKPNMAAPALPLVLSLAGSLIDWFRPLIKEKVSKEMDRHVGNPEISGQLAENLIEAAKRATGKADPIEAVAAARADPAAMAQVEESALEHLQRMAPLLDKLQSMDRERWAADEASRDAASRRAAGDPNDQDPFLTRSLVSIQVGLLISVVLLMCVLAWLKVDGNIIAGLAALFTTLATGANNKFGTRIDHRYGSSNGSVAKDAVIHELRRDRK